MKKIAVILSIMFLLSISIFAANENFAMPKVGFEKGNAIPDFTVTDLKGKKTSIKDYRGKVVMLNFWATWCPPCRAEMPSMEKLWNKSKDKNFVILAVSVDQDETQKVADFIKTNKYTFPVFHDYDGKLSEMFLVRSIPTTYILDKDGVILSKDSGAQDWSKLDVEAISKIKKGK